MPDLTAGQRTVVEAYAQVFDGQKAVELVLDDLVAFANTLPIEHQAGAFKVYGHILTQRSRLRRMKVKEAK